MQVPRVEVQKLRDLLPGESSDEVRVRVEPARRHQRNRFEGMDIASNTDKRSASILVGNRFELTLCAFIIFLHPKALTPKLADWQP